MKNIIVVTGGAGFVGSNLINYYLKKTKLNIVSLDDYSTGKKKNHIKNKRVKYINSNTKNISKILNRQKGDIEAVFHFGEFSRIVPSFKNYNDCFKSNFFGTYEVIKFCLNKKSRLVYSASSSTFGNNKYLSPYSWSKYNNNEL